MYPIGVDWVFRAMLNAPFVNPLELNHRTKEPRTMRLNRFTNHDGRGKYALILNERIKGDTADLVCVQEALKTLFEIGIADSGSDNPFFVIRLKDINAEAALRAYAESCRETDDPEFAADVSILADEAATLAGRSPSRRVAFLDIEALRRLEGERDDSRRRYEGSQSAYRESERELEEVKTALAAARTEAHSHKIVADSQQKTIQDLQRLAQARLSILQDLQRQLEELTAARAVDPKDAQTAALADECVKWREMAERHSSILQGPGTNLLASVETLIKRVHGGGHPEMPLVRFIVRSVDVPPDNDENVWHDWTKLFTITLKTEVPNDRNVCGEYAFVRFLYGDKGGRPMVKVITEEEATKLCAAAYMAKSKWSPLMQVPLRTPEE